MLRKYLVLMAGVVGLVGTAAGQGIPVIDVANLFQAMQQVQAWSQQLTQMQSQLQQQQQLYSSLNGTRGIGGLLNDPALMNALPPDWQQVYQAVQKGGYGGLTGSAAAIRNTNSIFDACAAETGTAKIVCQRSAGKSAQDKAFAQTAYQAAQNRLTNIQSLMGQIDGTTDPKAIADLQARIQTEQAMIQNEQTKLQLFKMLADAEDKQITQQQMELSAQRLARPGRTSDHLKLHNW